MRKLKILIIKLGYSETLDPEIGKHISLGDVLRTTPILSALKEKYKKSHISWLVSSNAEPLINNNKFINRVLIWDDFVGYQLLSEKFDIVINLEKVAGICALSDKIDAFKKYGFRYNNDTGYYDVYDQSFQFIDYINKKKQGNISEDCWQKSLIELLDLQWKNQSYSLGYIPKSKVSYDIGLNYQVGKKWPEKAMAMKQWKKLAKKLDNQDITYSWQEGLDSIYDYIDWINSCKIVITQDSLGLHIALALGKKVIALFGPTTSKEVCFYQNSVVLNAKDNNMKNIKIKHILENIKKK